MLEHFDFGSFNLVQHLIGFDHAHQLVIQIFVLLQFLLRIHNGFYGFVEATGLCKLVAIELSFALALPVVTSYDPFILTEAMLHDTFLQVPLRFDTVVVAAAMV